VDFCVENENIYLVALGDKEEFFDWYRPFKRTSLSALYELGHLPRTEEAGAPPVEGEPAPVELLEESIDAVVHAASEIEALRGVVGVLAGEADGILKRYEATDIFADTCIPGEEIGRALELLEERGLVRRQSVLDSTYYALTSRHVRERLFDRMDLSQSLDKRNIRKAIASAAADGRLLGPETLDPIGTVMERMVFTKKEMGLIVASAIFLGRDCAALLDKAERQLGGFDGDCLLTLLAVDDVAVRERAIRVLSRVNDEGIINPVLAHLRKEEEPALRALLVDDFMAVGKRKAIVALVRTLSEIGDGAAKARVLERIGDLPPMQARELLIRIADAEKDPETIDRIDGMLLKLEE
jgi:hypothetical protein